MMKMPQLIKACYFALLVVCIGPYGCISLETDLTIDVAPGVRECFFQTLHAETECEVEYQVIDGGDLDVNFVVQAPTGRVLVTEMRKMEGLHKIQVKETGDYQFCIDNTFSRFSNKVVFLELITDTDEDEESEPYKTVPDENVYDVKLDEFTKGLDRIMERLKRSTSTQNILRALESRDRSIQENNFERVNLWSGIQIFLMVSVALTHVLMIRGLFEDRSKTRPTKMTT